MKALPFLALALALALGTAAGGCSGRPLELCDITQTDCQQGIYYHVLNLRGDGYDPFGGLPPINVITEADFRAQLEREAAARVAQSGPDPWERALVLLHFEAPPTSDPEGGPGGSSIDDEVALVAAFYDPSSKRITIVSHPERTSRYAREEAMETLAHELVHALQDRELDLERSDFDDSDTYMAWIAMVEGDARFYEYLFLADLLRAMGRIPRDPTDYPGLELAAAFADLDQFGSPLFAARYLTYPLGASYLATAYRGGGNAAVRHAYAKSPARTVGFLVGDDGRSPPVGSGRACTPPAALGLPTTGRTSGQDQFGALLFYTFLRGFGVDHATAFGAARSWTGDRLLVQANAEVTTTAVAWRVEFSSPPPATLAAAIGASGELSATLGARSIEITTSDSPTPLTWQPRANCP
jgi:hypothetical protein